MLASQAGAAALPREGELLADLPAAGFEITDIQSIVPTEPFVAITATRRPDVRGGLPDRARCQ